MAISEYLRTRVLDHVFGGPDYTRPASVYVALCTSAPDAGDDGDTIVEPPASDGYSRQEIVNSGASQEWKAADLDGTGRGRKRNDELIEFGPASADWQQTTHYAILDGSGAGANMLDFGALTQPRTVLNGFTARIPINELQIFLSGS